MKDKVDEMEKDQRQPSAAYPGETIGSLMAECEQLTQYIDGEKERLERFMLETGGSSDESDRIEERIAILQDMLSSSEGRLQALFDEQEKEAFAPGKDAAVGQESTEGRTSVIKDLTERKAASAARKPPEMKMERNSPGKGMER